MKRKTEQDWAQLIEAQLQSKLTAVDFCRQHNLDQTYFSSRKIRYLKQLPKPQTAFVEAQVSPITKTITAYSLHWQTIELEFSSSTSATWLADLMKALVR